MIDALHGSLQTAHRRGGRRARPTTASSAARCSSSPRRAPGAAKGLATLTLIERAFKGGPTYAICKRHKAGDASAAAASSKTLQLLHASAHGKFKHQGRYAAATVRGTKWTIADRCDGTLTHDITDSVAVTDFVRHKTIILHAGQSYLALARTAAQAQITDETDEADRDACLGAITPFLRRAWERSRAHHISATN